MSNRAFYRTRREALTEIACGFGSVALVGLLQQETATAAEVSTRPSDSPLQSRPPHFPARAKRVIFLFMHGGVSHVDTFDPKPKLAEMNGRPLPIAKPKFEFGGTGNLLQSPWKFAAPWRVGNRGQRVVSASGRLRRRPLRHSFNEWRQPGLARPRALDAQYGRRRLQSSQSRCLDALRPRD